MLTLSCQSHRRFRASICAALALGLTVAFAGAPSSATAAPTPHSPQWLRKHCSISDFVDLGGNKPNTHKAGLSIHGKETPVIVNGTEEPTVDYTWHLSRQDQFCGIVGVWSGPPRPKYVSLTPTSQTAHGGTYIDKSVQNLTGGHLQGFFVYAKRRTG